MWTPCARLPAPRADHRNRKLLREVLADLLGRDLAKQRETTGVDEGHGVVDQLLGPVGGLALGEEAAELGHAHGRDADVPLNRNTGLDDRLDVAGMVLVALALHDLGVGLVHETAGVFDCLVRRDVKAPIGHVDHAQAVLAAAVDRLGHHHDFVEADRDRALVSEQNHPAGVRHAENVHAQAVGHHRGPIVVGRQLRDRLAFPHLLLKRADGYLSSRRCFAHVASPSIIRCCRADMDFFFYIGSKFSV